jgi:hypothetical protein
VLHPTVLGVITKTGFSNAYTHGEGTKGESISYDFRRRSVLCLTTDKQKKRRVRFEQKNGCYWYYNEGEEIVHFHGLPYPINLDPTAPHGYICLACGRMHKEYQPKCDFCLLELVDPAKVSKEQPKIDMTRYKKK